MLKDLTKADWLNILNLPESRVPAVLIVRGTRNFRSKYRAMLPYFDNVLDVGTPNGIVEDVLIGDVRGCPVGFACVYGGSMASEIVHIFGVLGTRAVIQIGNCGALADGFGAGDLFVAERAFCGEGAAQYYKANVVWVTASSELLQSRTLGGLRPKDYRAGAIYTTAALFAEGMEDVERWFNDGFAAVDMETAATYAVAESFGMQRISLLYAFDNPRQKEHLLLRDHDKDLRRTAANDRMTQLALDLAVEIAESAGARASAPSAGLRIRACRPAEVDAVMPITLPVLIGGSIQLEPMALSHRDGLRRAADDERIWQFMLMVARGPQFDTWFDDVLANHEAGRQMPFAVRRRADDRLVGSTSFLDPNLAHRRIEIGATWYSPEVWGTLLNTECKLLLLTHAFEALGLNRVSFVTDVRNERSQAAIAKLGAVREGVCRSHMITQGGRVRDSVLFSIIAVEWPEVKQRLTARLAAPSGSKAP